MLYSINSLVGSFPIEYSVLGYWLLDNLMNYKEQCVIYKLNLITAIFPAARNNRVLSTSSPITFQNCPNLLVHVHLTNGHSNIQPKIAKSLTSVLLVDDLPLLESSFTFSWPSLWNFCATKKTRVHDIILSPNTCWNGFKYCYLALTIW